MTFTANLIVNNGVDENGKRTWEAARDALIEFDAKVYLKQLQFNKLHLKVDGGLKSVNLYNREGEVQEEEGNTLRDVINLLIYRKLKNAILKYQRQLDYLGYFGLSNGAFNFKVSDG